LRVQASDSSRSGVGNLDGSGPSSVRYPRTTWTRGRCSKAAGGEIAIDTVDRQLVHHSSLLKKGRFTEIKPRGAAGNGSLATDVDDRGRPLGYIL
jgi:hypothetical protein